MSSTPKRGFRPPDHALPTPAELFRLRARITRVLKSSSMYKFTDSQIAAALGVSDRQVRNYARLARKYDCGDRV